VTRARCTRFDAGGLERLLAGMPPDAHEEDCADCRASRSFYEKLKGRIGKLPDPRPEEGWQAKVLDRIDSPATPAAPVPGDVSRKSSASQMKWVALAAAAVAAGSVLVFVRSRPPDRLSLSEDLVAVEPGMRAGAPAPGDRLRVTARVGSSPNATLRVYLRERDVVMECPGPSPCSSRDGVLTGEVTLGVPGTYRALVIAGHRPIAPTTGSLDADARAAEAAGQRVEMGQSVTVR
jgi:hypothetical protein